MSKCAEDVVVELVRLKGQLGLVDERAVPRVLRDVLDNAARRVLQEQVLCRLGKRLQNMDADVADGRLRQRETRGAQPITKQMVDMRYS